MKRRYVVISNWISKTTGEPQSSIAPISEGTSKEGRNYQITDTNNTTVIEGTYPVGTILESTTEFTTGAPTPPADKAPATPPPAPKSSKA